MPAPRKLPELPELKQLLADGLTHQAIAEKFGVGAQAVYRQLAKANETDERPRYRSSIPWQRIAIKHNDNTHLRYLRMLAKQELGEELTPVQQRRLDAWKAQRLAQNVVIAYHPDKGPNPASANGGFYFTPRLPEDGGGWVRRGSDEGQLPAEDELVRGADA